MVIDIHAARVAAEVRASLARQRRTAKFVGEVLDLSYPSVSRRLNGHVPFDVAELGKLAEALDVPLSSLLPPEPVEAVSS
jgi:transcriptional regulator with XRE-family HTH domain